MARDDALAFGAGDVAVEGSRGVISIPVAALLANDAGHGGRVRVLDNAADGSAALSRDGARVLYSFERAGFDGKDAFTYRVEGADGARAYARAYLEVDLSGGAPAPRPEPQPQPKPQPPAGAALEAVRDELVFAWEDVRVDRDTGAGAVSFLASDLLSNDRGGARAAEVVRAPAEGALRAAGEGSELTFAFDPARFDGRDVFTYRALGADGAASAPARAVVIVEGMPAPAPAPAALELVDAGADRALVALGAHTVLEADSVRGLALSVAARPAAPGAGSARMTLDEQVLRVENVEPFALFGDRGGDFAGGLALAAGEGARVAVELFGGPGASGRALGGAEARVAAQTGVLEGTALAPDVFAFDPARMGADTVRGFEGMDRLAFFGAQAPEAADALALARVVDGDTVLDFGAGHVLTLEGFAQLGADHLL